MSDLHYRCNKCDFVGFGATVFYHEVHHPTHRCSPLSWGVKRNDTGECEGPLTHAEALQRVTDITADGGFASLRRV